MAFVAGCGRQAEVPSQNNQEQGTIGVELGAEPAQASALTAADLLTQPGSRLDYLANTPGTTASVAFDLSGPWNFSTGPSNSRLTIVMIDKASAPGQELFPEATVAAQSSWNPATATEEYNFQDKDDLFWRSYGKFAPAGQLRLYSTGVKALMFPAAVGAAWSEAYSETENAVIQNVFAENRVVARNRLTVPAGTFEAFLLQNKVTSTSEGRTTVVWDYIWIVPGIGRAAEVISLPGEESQLFDTASAFYRLESYRVP